MGHCSLHGSATSSLAARRVIHPPEVASRYLPTGWSSTSWRPGPRAAQDSARSSIGGPGRACRHAATGTRAGVGRCRAGWVSAAVGRSPTARARVHSPFGDAWIAASAGARTVSRSARRHRVWRVGAVARCSFSTSRSSSSGIGVGAARWDSPEDLWSAARAEGRCGPARGRHRRAERAAERRPMNTAFQAARAGSIPVTRSARRRPRLRQGPASPRPAPSPGLLWPVPALRRSAVHPDDGSARSAAPS